MRQSGGSGGSGSGSGGSGGGGSGGGRIVFHNHHDTSIIISIMLSQ